MPLLSSELLAVVINRLTRCACLDPVILGRLGSTLALYSGARPKA